MNILLVQSPGPAVNYVPVGIAYLKSFLSKEHNVKVLDLNSLYYHHEPYIWNRLSTLSFYHNREMFCGLVASVFRGQSCNDFLPKFSGYLQKLADYSARTIMERYDVDLIGFSVLDVSIISSFTVASRIKELSPDIPVILGGPSFCNISSLNIIPGFKEMDFWNAVVFGEGEETLRELVEKFERGEISETKGALVKSNGKLIYGGERDEVDITFLPYPDFTDFMFKFYANPMTLPIMSSRGCTGNCTFCREKLFWKKYRKRKPEDVVSEIEERIDKYGFRSFVFCDSLINGDTGWLKNFCELIIEKKLDIIWDANARISQAMNGKLLKLLKKSGCIRLKYGVESGSPAVLKGMRKNIKNKLIQSVIRKTHIEGIYPHAYMIANFPEETYRDTLETIKFLYRNVNYIDGITIHSYYKDIEHMENNDEDEEQTLLIPNLLQLISGIHRISRLRNFYKDFLNLLVNIYSKIATFDHFIDLSNSGITEKKLDELNKKSLYVNICLGRTSVKSYIEHIRTIEPEYLALSLSWNNVKISDLKEIVKELTDELKKSGINYEIIKPVLPCLYGKKRKSPCSICFQWVNLKGLELEKMMVKYNKKNKEPLSFKEFQSKFCRSRISSYCYRCKEFRNGTCTGVCNNHHFTELSMKIPCEDIPAINKDTLEK